MIQAVMMFALGFSVCGLIALAASSALSRRTRRLAEQRVKRRYATKRLEFETERNELRARHAVCAQRLEREVRDLDDEATSYRLDAALKDIEINTLNSELDDKEDEIDGLSERLDVLHEQLRESDRKLAESGTALRAARHALLMQANEEALGQHPDAVNGSDHAAAASVSQITHLSTVPDTPESRTIKKVATEIQRLADETEAEVMQMPGSEGVTRQQPSDRRPPSDPDPLAGWPPKPAEQPSEKAVVPMIDPRRRELPPTAALSEQDEGAAEDRFREAMEQIQDLKKAGGRNAAE